MSIAIVNRANGANTDATVNTLNVPFNGVTTNAICVHVAVKSSTQTVSTVTDSHGNTYTKQASVLARLEVDYGQEGLDKYPMYEYGVEGEVWTTTSGGAVAWVLVTLTGPAMCAADIQSYSGSTGFGATASANLQRSSAPSISLVTTGANSFVSAGFSSAIGYLMTATTGTLRDAVTSTNLNRTIGVTIADATVAGLASTCTVTLAPTQTAILNGTSVGAPGTYAACAVELRS